jgi:hypothetical protein
VKADTRLAVLHWAETIDAMRVFPRLIMATYLSYAGWLTSYLVIWYCHLPAADRDTQVSTMVGGIIAAVTGFFPSVLKIYQDGGRDWTAANQTTTSSTVVATTTTQPTS